MQRPGASTLFARWFWLVYFPLGLLAACFAVFLAGLLPGWGRPLLIALALWGLAAGRLLIERRRLKLAVPPPRNLVVGTSWVAGLTIAGAVLGWMGASRLSTDFGVLLALIGAFFLTMALFVPAFKLLDLAIHKTAAVMLGHRAPGRASRPRAVPKQQRRLRSRVAARPATGTAGTHRLRARPWPSPPRTRPPRSSRSAPGRTGEASRQPQERQHAAAAGGGFPTSSSAPRERP